MSFNECSNLLGSMSFTGDKQENFFDYVYFKIAQNTENRFVEKNSDSIDIVLCDHPCIKVIPIYEKINIKNLQIDTQMKKAIEIVKNSDFPYVYFVYPKNDSFTQHIQIKIPELESICTDYMVKLIPYSLTKLKRGINNGTSCNK